MSTTLAMSWYARESWEQLKAVAEDKLCGTYEDLVRKTERGIRELEAQGIGFEKIPIDVDHMAAWSKRHGHRIDSRGRAIYGALLALHDGKLFDLDTPMVMP